MRRGEEGSAPVSLGQTILVAPPIKCIRGLIELARRWPPLEAARSERKQTAATPVGWKSGGNVIAIGYPARPHRSRLQLVN